MTREEIGDIRQCIEWVEKHGVLNPTWKPSDYWFRTAKKLLAEVEQMTNQPGLDFGGGKGK